MSAHYESTVFESGIGIGIGSPRQNDLVALID
jgi:hypothetical protein